MAAGGLGLVACGGGGDAEVREQALGARGTGSSGGPKPRLDAPILSCGGSTKASINLVVTAGASGMPGGFSLSWMKASDHAAHGWAGSDTALSCSAGFSGNAHLSRYNLGPNGSVTVNVGEFLFDNGASVDALACMDALECGVEYVFMAFAHGGAEWMRSLDSANQICATLPCSEGCTYTQGYWKTHGPVPTGNNEYVWPQSVKDGGMTLGSVAYSPEQLLAVFNTPAKGNGLVALAHQLMAAKLNVASGAGASAIAATIVAADTLIAGLVCPPVGGGSIAPASTSALTEALSAWNEGASGPGHCA